MGVLAGVETWKGGVYRALATAGRVGTVLGNYRYRRSPGALSESERRWALSQVVQGTGALILKRLINRIAAAMPSVGVILPMHDALLLELPSGDVECLVLQLVTQFREVFSETCPGVDVRVAAKPFAGGSRESSRLGNEVANASPHRRAEAPGDVRM
jgi:DNA polymerase I-like protein with 3'-5' exonuclease and polymerase domains